MSAPGSFASWRLALPALLATSLGCGPAKGSSEPRFDDRPRRSVDEVLSRLAESTCKSLAGANDPAFAEACMAHVASEVRPFVEGARPKLALEALDECAGLSFRDALVCARGGPGRAVGQGCGSSFECASGLCSNFRRGCGVCVATPALGEPCELGDTCAGDAFCVASKGQLGRGTCARDDAPRCDLAHGCGAHQECRAGRCRSRGAGTGGPCSPSAPCSPGNVCVDARGGLGVVHEPSRVGTCVALPQLGQACDGICAGLLVCDRGERVCREPLPLGASCRVEEAWRCGRWDLCRYPPATTMWTPDLPTTCQPAPPPRADCAP